MHSNCPTPILNRYTEENTGLAMRVGFGSQIYDYPQLKWHYLS